MISSVAYDKYVFGEVIANFCGIVTIRITSPRRTFDEGDTVPIVGRHKFPIGSIVGIYFNGARVERTLALIKE